MAYSVSYNFNPNDTAWVLSGQTIETGVVLQTSIIIAVDTTNTPVTTITYLVLLNCNGGTVTVTDNEIFTTFAAASTALQTYIAGLTC